MKLTREQESMLAGAQGEAKAFALRILVKLGDLYGADEFIPITQAHVDGCCYQTAGDAGLDFIERLADLGARVTVPTTTNVSGRDIRRWQEHKFPEWLGEKCRRMEDAYLAIGCLPTWTCAPYLGGLVPRCGEQIVWAESNAIAFVNSVIGARTHRYGDFVDACAAVTGLAPRFGLHLRENRRGSILVRLAGFSREELADDTSLYGLLGYLIGARIGAAIPVLEGVPEHVRTDCLKSLAAAGAASGSLALFHVVGVTPEAPTLTAAFGGRDPKEELTVVPADLAAVRAELENGDDRVDLVALGCPHFSHAEAWDFLRMLGGRRIAAGVECFIFTSRSVLSGLRSTGIARELEEAGVMFATDTCILHWPLAPWGFRTMATNSAKFAKYAPGLIGVNVRYGSLARCAAAATTGRMESGET